MRPIDFELDSKVVVDSFSPFSSDFTEFDDIKSHFRNLFSSFYEHSSAKCVRRQVNDVAHVLAKTTTFQASFQIMVENLIVLNTI